MTSRVRARERGATTGNRRRWPRRRTIALAAVLVVLLGWPLPLLLAPRPDAPGTSDAILVLGPPDEHRLALAEQLMAQGKAKALVVSVDSAWSAARMPICTDPHPYPVSCFEPDPSTTLGEGQEYERQARANGWTSVQAITFGWHVNRARVILGRCVTGDVRVLQVPGPDDPLLFLHHVAGWYKLAVTSGC